VYNEPIGFVEEFFGAHFEATEHARGFGSEELQGCARFEWQAPLERRRCCERGTLLAVTEKAELVAEI